MLLKAKQVPEMIGMQGDLKIEGRITRVFDKKSGTGEHGPWSFQSIIVADDSGEMTVSFKNRSETLTSADVDKLITAKSKETKNGILGVKVEKEEYKDSKGEKKETIKVVLTSSAIVELNGQAPAKSESSPSNEQPLEAKIAMPEAKPQTDYKALRKESIELCFKVWKEQVLDGLPIDSPSTIELYKAVIEAAGKNADTLMISQCGGRR